MVVSLQITPAPATTASHTASVVARSPRFPYDVVPSDTSVMLPTRGTVGDAVGEMGEVVGEVVGVTVV